MVVCVVVYVDMDGCVYVKIDGCVWVWPFVELGVRVSRDWHSSPQWAGLWILIVLLDVCRLFCCVYSFGCQGLLCIVENANKKSFKNK